MPTKGLLERLKDGDTIIIAEGYMWEFERRGYLQMGGQVPEVVLENPDMVTAMHQEFVHSGSDVVEAFTYYGHREKMRLIGREDDLEKLNRDALRIARQVADDTGTLMAGNLSNTGMYEEGNKENINAIKDMFKEQVEWAVEGGADYIIGETYNSLGEAMLALEAIKQYGKGLPAVITMTAYVPDRTLDDLPYPVALRKLEEAGAAVVGLNCSRGPDTMLPLLRECRKECKGPLAAIPVPFRTTQDAKTFFALTDPVSDDWLYPLDLDCCRSSRTDVKRFAEEAKKIGVQYIGLCCGNTACLLREVAIIYGREPSSCRYSPDMSNNMLFGDESKIKGQMRRHSSFATGKGLEEFITEHS